MNKLILVIAIGSLCGCSAKNPVLKATEWKDEYKSGKPSGVVFALPQTRLELSYSLERKTFSQGKHTDVLDACQEEGWLTLANDAVCEELRASGFTQSQRLSDPEKRYKDRFCSSDGSEKEGRTTVSEGVTLQSDFVPDESEVYVVPLRRSFFQTFEAQLELNANGTIGKGSLSTENLGTTEFLAAAVKVAMTAVAASAPEEEQKPEVREPEGPNPDAGAVAAASRALAELRELIRKRDEISSRNDDDALASRAVQLTYLDNQIARAKASFTGAVRTAPAGQFKAQWIPSESLPWANIGGEFDACAAKPKEQLRHIRLAVESHGIGLAPPAAAGLDEANFSLARGWPYRVPAERDVAWQVCKGTPQTPPPPGTGTLPESAPVAAGQESTPPTESTTAVAGLESTPSEPICESIDSKRLLLAQFGPTLRLPEATGGRKSVIAPEYYADGSLKKVVVSHVGESPAPLIAGAQDLLTPAPKVAPPSETAALTSEAALITARQALCRLVLAVPATDERCLGPNPPTTKPTSP